MSLNATMKYGALTAFLAFLSSDVTRNLQCDLVHWVIKIDYRSPANLDDDHEKKKDLFLECIEDISTAEIKGNKQSKLYYPLQFLMYNFFICNYP